MTIISLVRYCTTATDEILPLLINDELCETREEKKKNEERMRLSRFLLYRMGPYLLMS